VSNERVLRDQLVEVARALHERGWVANHDGNVTARLGRGRVLATPTAVSKRRVGRSDLLVVDDRGARVSGTTRAFSEVNLHLEVYRQRSDVCAVVHAHPPHATAIACSGARVLDHVFLAEAVVSLGPRVPTVEFAAPGPTASGALADHVRSCDAVLLAHHGVLTWGPDLELAYLRMELVEHLATIATAAMPFGGVKPLPDAVVPVLLEARARAGLTPAEPTLPATHSGSNVDRAPAAPALAELVWQELLAALKR
jgi:L-fuculose-phosphate aldolase